MSYSQASQPVYVFHKYIHGNRRIAIPGAPYSLPTRYRVAYFDTSAKALEKSVAINVKGPFVRKCCGTILTRAPDGTWQYVHLANLL